MKDNEFIEQHLKSIQKVDAPSFLLTRIEAKLNSNQRSVISSKKIAIAFSFTIALIVGNLFILNQMNTSTSDSQSSVFESMNLVKSNQLYHE